MWRLYALAVGALGIAGVYVYGLATSAPIELAKRSMELASCKRDLAIRDSREASFRRMIDRRDDAIAASQCKAQIQHWVRNPHKIPKPFNPHEQLKPPGIK